MPMGASYHISSPGSLLRQILAIQIIMAFTACFLIYVTTNTSVYRDASVNITNKDSEHINTMKKPPYTIVSTAYLNNNEKDMDHILCFTRWIEGLRSNFNQRASPTTTAFPAVIILYASISSNNHRSSMPPLLFDNSNQISNDNISPITVKHIVDDAFYDILVDRDKESDGGVIKGRQHEFLLLSLTIKAIATTLFPSVHHYNNSSLLDNNNNNSDDHIVLWVDPTVTLVNSHLLHSLPTMVRRSNGLWLPSGDINSLCNARLFGFDASNEKVVTYLLAKFSTACH
ncbi:hypothetical protein BDA99DRAFT_305142 [Phascolomyces articulosus]|uniref:Uncharacterized protein n=1 Tax=Phascolomyces articulosus TaxID=60185 RepID=A0AAD5PGV2_9FUNG|nr:hypothetical protein BDA99DRAFT_305142 [Phascolomyces articulosus]